MVTLLLIICILNRKIYMNKKIDIDELLIMSSLRGCKIMKIDGTDSIIIYGVDEKGHSAENVSINLDTYEICSGRTATANGVLMRYNSRSKIKQKYFNKLKFVLEYLGYR